MAEYIIQEETLVSIADEIRDLSGTTSELTTDEMVGKLGEANEDVINQVDLIEQLRSTVNSLPEAGSGGNSANTLFGTYTFLYSMDYPGAEFELRFAEDEVFAYFDAGEGHTLFSVAKLTVTSEKIELTPFDETALARFYDFNATSHGWEDSSGRYGDGWERLMFFRVPITTTDVIYQSFISLLDDDGDPYQIGYDLGYNVGYSDGEASGASGGLLEEFGYMPMFAMSDFFMFINGGLPPVVPKYDGNVSIMYPGELADTSGAHYYIVEWVDYDLGEFRVVEEIFPTLTTIDNGFELLTVGALQFYYDTPLYGLLITSTEHEVEG